MIRYVIGDVTRPRGDGNRIVVQVVNDMGGYGAGVSGALARRWPAVAESYKDWVREKRAERARVSDALRSYDLADLTAGADEADRVGQMFPLTLGDVRLVDVQPATAVPRAGWVVVANLVGQHGVGVVPGKRPPIRYTAIRAGLATIRRWARGRVVLDGQLATIHMPRIGAGLAGGEWPKIERLIHEQLGQFDVTVYDLSPWEGTTYEA